MAVYAIGDIQGCYDDFRRLLDMLAFDAACDRLWLVGDLVNRGPNNLSVLRFVKQLGDRAVNVLGNHELHLLALAYGKDTYKPRKDTLADVLEAPDREELLHWLRHRPLLHHSPELGFTMLHAGLPPQWDLEKTRACAGELEAVLRGPDHARFFANMYGNEPCQWSDDLTGWARLRFITNCFTRLRYCDPQGRLAIEYEGPLGSQPHPYLPWFQVPSRASRALNLVFGHWSSLGLHREPGIYALDTGCIWGGCLTALRLDKQGELIRRIRCPGHRRPNKIGRGR